MPAPIIPESVVQEAIEKAFQCHRCGNCCKGEGVVHLKRDEAVRIAEFLDIPLKKFLKEYTIRVAPGEWWLLDKANPERWCIFLEQDADGLYGCAINSVKPDQCRKFPEKWRNEDSFKSCAGLRAVMATLRQRGGSGESKSV